MKPLDSPTGLTIRPVLPEDAQAMNEIAGHPKVARTLLQLPSKEIAQTENLLRNQKPGHHRLVAVKNAAVIGLVNLNQPQNPRLVHSASLGIMVHPHYWGQGVGTALMTAILDLGDNWLNLKRIGLGVRPSNKVAVGLYEKFGFVSEGTKKEADFADGCYQDQLLMARIYPNAPQTQPIAPVQYPCKTRDVVSITIRPVRPGDGADLHEIFTHPAVGSGTNQLPSRERPTTIEWLQQQNPGQYRYSAVAQHNNGSSKVIGNLTMHQYQKTRMMHVAWFGMSVHPHYWGLGVGSQLVETALDLADNWLGLKRVELDVLTDNAPAIKLCQKFGFEIEGTKRLYSYGAGRWANAHFMARLKR